MCLLTLVVSVPALRPPSCGHGYKAINCNKRASGFQKGIFYCALYIIAVGTGGTKPNISTMGADQFDDFEPKERVQKLSFFNWWMFSIFFGTLFSNTFLIYIQDNVGWSLGYGIPTIGLLVSVLVFLVGTPFYRHKLPLGSPFTRIFQVLVAAVRKWNMPVPTDPKELHELSLEEYSKSKQFRIDYTPSLRFLDKAAVKTGPNSAWKLCPVTQVEETKQMIIVMIIACFAERKRLSVAREHQKLGAYDSIPLSIFILLPQFALVGVADAFVEVAKLEFFYDQAPEGMKSLGTSYFTSSIGIGHFLGSFILTTVSDMTKRHGHRGWILDNLNTSHLDYYFAFLAALGFLNFLFFLAVAKLFVYNADVKESDTGLQEATDASQNKASSKVEALRAGTSY
ncbi:hypothetical protein Gotri_021457 [Gossypium trilobum]|uniref:Uncharacterized protein n=1 Tax=Gossypium trilobum TaxID=34281 RepID=A0A7J9DCZ8_9ROSI|nr:hypothetical protein [Gossypium trilobum]